MPASYHVGAVRRATASVVTLIEIQNIKRTALCPTVTRCARLTDANSLSLVRYRFEMRAPAIAYHDAVPLRPARYVIRTLPARAESANAMLAGDLLRE